MVIPSKTFGRSGLSDEQLAHHWARLREFYPIACEGLDNPLIGLDVEESKGSTSFIQTYLIAQAGLRWSDRQYAYVDLLDFYGRQRLAKVMGSRRIERITDYGIVRNSLECHPYRFSDHERVTMARLLAAFVKMHPELVNSSGWKTRPRALSWLKALMR